MGEPFSILLVIGGIAVLFGTRLVVVDPASPTLSEPNQGDHPRQPILALQLAIVAAFLWSAALLTISDALEDVDPLTAASLRLPFMAVVLVVMTSVRGDMHVRSVTRRDFGSLALSGSLVLTSMLLFLTAADLAPAGTVAVLSSTGPIFAVPMAHFLLKEHVTQRVLTGTIACMLGVFLASAA
jgi:drug/metabolite transporter (DMT)-like permease